MMNNYEYDVKYSNNFKKSLKKVLKQGKDISKLKNILSLLSSKKDLDTKYRNHKLVNNKRFKDCWELHIEPDWLLVYKYLDDKLLLLLVDTGSHSEILDI